MPSHATSRYWRGRMAAARTPREQADVEWDRLRAEIAKLPEGPYRDAAWRLAGKYLARCRDTVTTEIARDAQ